MRIWILTVAVVIALAGVAGGAYWFGGKSDHEPALVLNTMPASSDGIQVHGHWTMTVTNPDGTVEALHEFDNSLHPDMGASFLTALLAGQTSMTRPLSDAPYRIGMNKWQPPGINRDWYCEEYVEISSTHAESAIVKAAMVRGDSLGNPLELSGICTVTGIPDTETASVVAEASNGRPEPLRRRCQERWLCREPIGLPHLPPRDNR